MWAFGYQRPSHGKLNCVEADVEANYREIGERSRGEVEKKTERGDLDGLTFSLDLIDLSVPQAQRTCWL